MTNPIIFNLRTEICNYFYKNVGITAFWRHLNYCIRESKTNQFGNGNMGVSTAQKLYIKWIILSCLSNIHS